MVWGRFLEVLHLQVSDMMLYLAVLMELLLAFRLNKICGPMGRTVNFFKPIAELMADA